MLPFDYKHVQEKVVALELRRDMQKPVVLRPHKSDAVHFLQLRLATNLNVKQFIPSSGMAAEPLLISGMAAHKLTSGMAATMYTERLGRRRVMHLTEIQVCN